METEVGGASFLLTSFFSFLIISPQGDGNEKAPSRDTISVSLFFSAHFPERGWKRKKRKFSNCWIPSQLFRSFPRKGMETFLFYLRHHTIKAFPLISPKGDGNASASSTSASRASSFSAHFPARGWKLHGNRSL